MEKNHDRKLFLENVYPLLKVLHKLDNENRKIILNFLDNEGCKGLYDCIDNAIYNHTLPEEIRNNLYDKLFDERKKYKFLADTENRSKKNQFKKKKKLISVNSNIEYILDIVLPLIEKYLEIEKNE